MIWAVYWYKALATGFFACLVAMLVLWVVFYLLEGRR